MQGFFYANVKASRVVKDAEIAIDARVAGNPALEKFDKPVYAKLVSLIPAVP